MGDYLIRATGEGGVLALVARTTDLVERARQLHRTSPTATAALGRLLTGGALMAATLKEGQSLTLRINGDGPLGSLVVVARPGKIKGYVGEPQVELPLREDGKLDVGRAVGRGTLYVVKDLGLKEPYVGSVELVSGEIGEDLAHYFVSSEQKPSAVGVGVRVEPEGKVGAAGGFLVQLLPGAGEAVAELLENNLREAGPVSSLLAGGLSPEDIAHLLLKGLSFKVYERQPLRWACDCSRERLREVLLALGPQELERILVERGEAEATCAFCSRVYRFDRDEVEELLELSRRDSGKEDGDRPGG
ncbi:MAG TPA: Hsp33 family molecular chaperone HslO [Peptococcaceae bacterium]|nr:MAG: 33 kDa chaperonin [Moorella sp. 60_41]HBT47042.1 Hsp33 family molecular chaperone HslO [Peptococcaceae bacterium]